MKFFAVLALCIVGAIAHPLTSDEAALVKSSWAQVKHNEVDILYTVFKAYPDIQARFPQFAGKDLDSIKTSGQFATHATRIVSFFSELIALSGSESNLSAIYGLISKMGTDHKNRGITQTQFNEFRTALVSYISSNVSWGDNVAAAWTHALDNVYTAVFQIVTA
uniref:Globin CTT-Z n=1 Tax=Chironomus thummi piger TaxID=7156 RepID=GLBZ_CHITP|nr:RecName: Full=Globin CTT-Z; AltName: Full=HBZ; Flags: Precursor [Chironomus piger]CAA39717.1 Ctp HbZ [Chironomus thummi]